MGVGRESQQLAKTPSPRPRCLSQDLKELCRENGQMKDDLRFHFLPPFLKSQAEAHYKGNRHARRVKGIEAAKTRGREPGVREPGDPAPPSSTPSNGDGVAPRPGVFDPPTFCN